MKGWSTAKRTKIVCTIGPASSPVPVLESMIGEGMDVARLNFSHGTREEHRRTARLVRKLSDKLDRPVAVLGDLAGPRIRVGKMEDGKVLATGATVTLTPRDIMGSEEIIPVSYAGLAKEVAVGDAILLADGSLELRVEEQRGDDLMCRVVVGGLLMSHKGVNVPTRALSLPSLTEKDVQDLSFAVANDFDMVAQSFVQSPEDIGATRAVMQDEGRVLPIIAKVERKGALDRIEDITAASDGVMVARGDLGVEIPLAKVPEIQKRIINHSRRLARPVITATQMLQSMVTSTRPTRAEATDVYNAVLDGTDAIMLSEETAMGQHPVEAVRFLAAIAREADVAVAAGYVGGQPQEQEVAGAVAGATVSMAQSLRAAAIVAPTSSGRTPRAIARHRPQQPVLALCSDPLVLRTLCLTWGVVPIPFSGQMSVDSVIKKSRELAASEGITPGNPIVVAMGYPPRRGLTNMVLVPETQ